MTSTEGITVYDGNEEPTYVVHKHHFPLDARPFSLPIWHDADLARVDRQPGDPAASANLWEVHRTDTIRPAVVPRRWFVVRGTGDSIEGQAEHVATWLEGRFVWHLFEVDGPKTAR